jgi:hydroxymethylbilane synthase
MTIGSRGSALALWQANWVQAQLESLGHTCRIRIIHTTGDKITDVALSQVGGKGLFTKEIEEALLAGSIDLAVHSLKDLPTELPRGLTLAAIPEREDARDAMVGCRIEDLPRGARVGTSSLRRSAQLQALRPGVVAESVRGNVDTRLRKLDEGRYDALLLAAAGLRRLGCEARIAESLAPEVMCPAAGQGALAIETRDDAGPAQQACRRLEHPATRAAITAERALLASLGGGCQVPIGAHATVTAQQLYIRALVISPDGTKAVKRDACGAATDAQIIGAQLGADLLEGGGREILHA